MAMTIVKMCIVTLYLLMSVRAIQSGTMNDRLLVAAMLIGLILLFVAPLPLSACWLIACAGGYLISQVVTSARMLSRGLPLLAGTLTGVLWWMSDTSSL